MFAVALSRAGPTLFGRTIACGALDLGGAGQVVARNMLGHRDRFDDIPFFWSAHYDKLSIQYTGHVEHWDETRIEGDVMKLDCAVSYLADGKRRAMATINRDRQNLETEVEMERELLLKPPPPVTVEPSAVNP